uniref:Uncharacterized protein LOC104228814 n=1 Tax=Nicotiana sylvestris TaxID=4096 RepID=A0A1U7WYB3_NICSY|nr:PREDICTED: uncharacterized protein LOC104228814 [Nicotiana sylvestris]
MPSELTCKLVLFDCKVQDQVMGHTSNEGKIRGWWRERKHVEVSVAYVKVRSSLMKTHKSHYCGVDNATFSLLQESGRFLFHLKEKDCHEHQSLKRSSMRVILWREQAVQLSLWWSCNSECTFLACWWVQVCQVSTSEYKDAGHFSCGGRVTISWNGTCLRKRQLGQFVYESF